MKTHYHEDPWWSGSQNNGMNGESPSLSDGLTNQTRRPRYAGRYLEKTVNTDRFWQIIETATRHDPETAEEWDTQLVEQLAKLSADDILAWDRIFADLTSRAYRNDLWAAAYLINGGASDDGFFYFRCWLVGMGRNVCINAIEDPDSLADVVQSNWMADGIDAEAEIYAAGFRAWQTVTGVSDDAPYPVQNPKTELAGDELDFDDDEAMRHALPRLFTLIDTLP